MDIVHQPDSESVLNLLKRPDLLNLRKGTSKQTVKQSIISLHVLSKTHLAAESGQFNPTQSVGLAAEQEATRARKVRHKAEDLFDMMQKCGETKL